MRTLKRILIGIALLPFMAAAQAPSGVAIGAGVSAGAGVSFGVDLYKLVLGTNIDFYSQVSTSPGGDSMSPTWGPSSDGSTTYNNGTGNRTVPGWVVTTLADSHIDPPYNDANTQIIRLVNLDFSNPLNCSFVFLNGMTDFGGSSQFNVPAGWRGMPTSGGSSAAQVSFHILGGVSIGGWRMFAMQRNGGNGDVGIIESPPDDNTPYENWFNAYHAYQNHASTQACASNVVTIASASTINSISIGDKIYIRGANTNNGVRTASVVTSNSVSYSDTCTNVSASASGGTVSYMSHGGDAGRCDAVVDDGPCLNAGYTKSMMWRGTEAVTMQNLKPFVYGQDGGGTGPDGSGTWCYFMGYNGYQYLHRIACADLKGEELWVNAGGWTDPANWTHYKCLAGMGLCDGTNNAFWVALSADATPITGLAIDTGQNEGPIMYKGGKYYMLLNLFGGHGVYTVDAIGLNVGPAPWGPYTMVAQDPVPSGDWQDMGFPTLMFPFIDTISGTQFKIPMMADSNTGCQLMPPHHDCAGSPVFNLMTVTHQ